MEQPRSRPPSRSRSRSGTPQFEDSENEYNPALEQDRQLNDNRLKSRFEEIFSKYGKDFTGVGDEIDLATGDIVVDNGHLERMQHEADPGHSESSQFVRAFAENLEHEDEQQGEEQDVEDYSVLEESDEGGSEGEDGFETAASSREETPAMPQQDYMSRRGSETTGSVSAPSVNMDDAMPGFSESMQVLQAQMLQPQAGTGQAINPDAIQALGVSIAKQLAQLMGTSSKEKETSNSHTKRKDPAWDYPELPQDKRQRLQSPPRRVETRQPAAPLPPSPEARASLWAPVQHPRQIKRKSQAPRNNTLLGATAARDISAVDDESAREDRPTTSKQPKICANCGTGTTPHWRVGPEKQDWCNSCASYDYRYGGPPPQTDSDDYDDFSEDLETDEEEYGGQVVRNNIREYSTEEDAMIIKLKEIDGKKWRETGPLLGPKRSRWAIQARYSKYLHNQPSAGRTALVERGYICHDNVMEPRVGGFTDTENEVIMYLREKAGLDWIEIAKRIPDATAEAVELRFQLLEDLRYIEENPSIAREILQEVEKPNTKPAVKAEHELMPKLNTDGIEENSRDEDRLVIQLREVHGLTWDQIQEKLPGRTLATIRRRYAHDLPQRKWEYEETHGKGAWEARNVHAGEFVNCAAGSAPGTYADPNIQIIPEKSLERVEMNLRNGNSQLERPDSSHPQKILDLLEDGWQNAGPNESSGSYGTFKLRMPKRKANGPKSSQRVSRELERQKAREAEKALPAPEIPKKRYGTDFTEEEDALLIKLHYEQELTCAEIAEKHMTNRSARRLNARYKCLRRGHSGKDRVKPTKPSNHLQTPLLRQVLDTTVEYSLANAPALPLSFHRLLGSGHRHHQSASSDGRFDLGGNVSLGTKDNPLCLDEGDEDSTSSTHSHAAQTPQTTSMIQTPFGGSASTMMRHPDGAFASPSYGRQPGASWPPSVLAQGYMQGQVPGSLPSPYLACPMQPPTLPLYAYANNQPFYPPHGHTPLGYHAPYSIQPPTASSPNQAPPRIQVAGGTWVMVPDTENETFDKAYVRAHPEEDFYHTGDGVYKRGDAHETFTKAYVMSHPHEQFYHSGKGYYKRGVKPTLPGAAQATTSVAPSQPSLATVPQPEIPRPSISTGNTGAGGTSLAPPGPAVHPITTVAQKPKRPRGRPRKESTLSAAETPLGAQRATKSSKTNQKGETLNASTQEGSAGALASKSTPTTMGRTGHANDPSTAYAKPTDHEVPAPQMDLDLDDAFEYAGADDEFTVSIDNTTPERRTPELDEDDAQDETPPTTPANFYLTPARYNQQSQPYYLAPPADLYSPQDENIPPEAALAQGEAAIDPSLFSPVQPQKTQPVLKRKEPIPKRTRPATVKPARPAIPRRSLGDPVPKNKPIASTLLDKAPPLRKDVSQPPHLSLETTVSTFRADTEMDDEDELLSSPKKSEASPLERPNHKFKDLISMALNSSADKKMACKDIIKYVEDNFEYYRENKGAWKETLRGALSNSKAFQRITSDFASVWSFAEAPKKPIDSPVVRSSSPHHRTIPQPTTFVEVNFAEGVYTADDEDEGSLADYDMADPPPASWPTTIRDSQDSNVEISPLHSTNKSKAKTSVKNIDLTVIDDSDIEDEDLELRRHIARHNRRAQSGHETSDDDNYVDLTASDEETADEPIELSSPAPVRKARNGPIRPSKPFPKFSSDIARDPKSSPATRTAGPDSSSAIKPQSLPRLPSQKNVTYSNSSPFPRVKNASNLNTYGKTKTPKTLSKLKPQASGSSLKRADSASRLSAATSGGFTPISRSNSVVNLPGSNKRVVPLQEGFGEDDDTSEDELA